MTDKRLEWDDAQVRHRRALQRFCCTEEPLKMEVSPVGKRPVHPAMWEYQVQEFIKDFRVPPGRSWIARIGLQPDGSAGAFLLTQEIDAGAHYDLACGAVAANLRNRGLCIGDEMMDDTLNVITAKCLERETVGDVLLTAKVHRQNSASQKMLHRYGFRNVGSLDGDDHDDWERYLTV